MEAALRKKLNAEGGYPTYVVIDQKGTVHPNSITVMSDLSREKFIEAAGLN
ncbi:hypothetical protein NIASO_15280 [Niabella soli DSM 19437]|uniref:Thioredoxin-like fold domain-containing protein n=1 Tax=Niabella soli DSM 19437 TaxID=929713 RepID=W0F4B6_9BACT|nr:hypothetical protein NIASO_15280 [Niabella soli DSM 19437]